MDKKILIIDDEAELVSLLQFRLEANGYEVICAYDGEEGLEKAKEKPDLILLDKVLPKIDGLVVCQRIKGDPQTRAIPIIVISASGGKDLSERAKKAGADYFIFKPFDPKELLDKIADLLKK